MDFDYWDKNEHCYKVMWGWTVFIGRLSPPPLGSFPWPTQTPGPVDGTSVMLIKTLSRQALSGQCAVWLSVQDTGTSELFPRAASCPAGKAGLCDPEAAWVSGISAIQSPNPWALFPTRLCLGFQCLPLSGLHCPVSARIVSVQRESPTLAIWSTWLPAQIPLFSLPQGGIWWPLWPAFGEKPMRLV